LRQTAFAASNLEKFAQTPFLKINQPLY